jgi:L-aminopeptidase/D-esterase-like protein
MDTPGKRVRELGISPGILPLGSLNAIPDVHGVEVGPIPLIEV